MIYKDYVLRFKPSKQIKQGSEEIWLPKWKSKAQSEAAKYSEFFCETFW